jgi:oligoendopeptidase F
MPVKKIDTSKIAGDGAKLQTLLVGRINELKDLKAEITKFKAELAQRLEKLETELGFNPVNAKFKTISAEAKRNVFTPHENMAKHLNTLTEALEKFKDKTKDLDASYNFAIVYQQIKTSLSEFKVVYDKTAPMVDDINLQISDFEEMLELPHAKQLLRKTEKNVDKLAKEIMNLAKQKAGNTSLEALNLNDLLEKLENLTTTASELKTITNNSPRVIL